MIDEKKYVPTTVLIKPDGSMTPLGIVWEGIYYKIDKASKPKQAFSPYGGNGLRYDIKIQGQTRYLYYERDKFFITR